MSFAEYLGQVFAGKYRVEQILGKGGMGVVLGARHIMLDDLVAIKVLLPELIHEEELVKRFMQEARASAKIKNGHVVRVTDVARLEDGTPYMVMELLHGTNLSDLVAKRKTLEIGETIEYVLQVCDALADAHEKGIYHRDLKPGNMFLTRSRDGAPYVKLLDFGISKMVSSGGEDLTKTEAAIGTPPYMSPEQFACTKMVDHRTDIWSLGIILYRLLTGRVPFRSTEGEPLQLHVERDPPQPPREVRPEIPQALEDIILHCLEKQPSDRFRSVDDLTVELKKVATACIPTSVPTPEPQRAVPTPPIVQPEPAPPPSAKTATDPEPHVPQPSANVVVNEPRLGDVVTVPTWEKEATGGSRGSARRATARKVVFVALSTLTLLLAGAIVLRRYLAPSPEAGSDHGLPDLPPSTPQAPTTAPTANLTTPTATVTTDEQPVVVVPPRPTPSPPVSPTIKRPPPRPPAPSSDPWGPPIRN